MDEKRIKPKIVWKEFSEVEPHPRNPRIHTEDQIQWLQRSIQEYGDGKIAISFQKSTGYVLTGHGLIEAKKKEGKTGSWMMELDFPEGKAEAWMIADNKLQERSSWNIEERDVLIRELQDMGVEIERTGFTQEEIEIPAFEPTTQGQQPRLDQKSPIVCPECGHEFIPKS